MKSQKIIAIFIVSVFWSHLFGQRSTGYNPMPDGKYESVRIPFMSSDKNTTLPTTYIIPENYFPAPGNQGEFGSCVAWATGYALGSFYFSAKNNWGKPVSSSKIMSPSYVYHHIRECNCGPNCGTYIGDALELMKTKGIVSWEMMPYDENNCTPPGNSMLNAASVNKIKGYNRLNNKMNLNEYKTYLSNDVPIITGTSLGANFDYYGSRGNTSTFTCSQLKPNSGHAMLMVGYDDNRKAFKIMNSWGSDWGEKGYVWVDYECFKLMMGSSGSEAYVISKDYELSKDTHPSDDIVTTDEQNTGSDLQVFYEDLQPFGYFEELGNQHYFIAYGINISHHLQNEVEKVVYVFDHPDFYNKYVRSTEGPYFQASFEGPYCLPDMQAIVIMKDGSKYRVEFDGCEILQHEDSYEADYVEIIPTVTATPTPERPGYYRFDIRLRGTEELKHRISKVVYDYNDPSFSNRFVSVTDSRNGYRTGYNGWGCLYGLGVTIYYTDGTNDSFSIDMCEELGW